MSGPFSPFKVPANVPIVGQYKLLAWAPTAVIECSCAAHQVLHVVGFAPVVCSACLRTYQPAHIQWDAKVGLMRFAFKIGQLQPAGDN